MIPGEYFVGKKDIEANAGKEVTRLGVINTGDRPVQVGSHFHFFEVNRQLELDREKAFGKRLNIAAGTAVRFEPGEEKEVELIPLSGRQKVHGINNLVNGSTVHPAQKTKSLEKAALLNFKNKSQ